MEEENNKKSRNIGILATTLFHGAIALIFFFLMAWTAPDPPRPDTGVEINLGFEPVGTGDVQTDVDPGNEGVAEEATAQPEQPQPEEVKEETKEEQPAQPTVTNENNPVSVKTEKEEVKEVKTEVKTETKKEVKPTETKKQEVKTETVFDPNKTTDKTANQKKGENKSEGDDKNASGNKGQPDGKLADGAQYTGTTGGGNNGDKKDGLDLDGWTWDHKPAPKIPGNERGVIVYEIQVNDNGDFRIQPITILSPEIDRICREEIGKIKFTATGDPKAAKGRITITIKAD